MCFSEVSVFLCEGLWIALLLKSALQTDLPLLTFKYALSTRLQMNGRENITNTFRGLCLITACMYPINAPISQTAVLQVAFCCPEAKGMYRQLYTFNSCTFMQPAHTCSASDLSVPKPLQKFEDYTLCLYLSILTLVCTALKMPSVWHVRARTEKLGYPSVMSCVLAMSQGWRWQLPS